MGGWSFHVANGGRLCLSLAYSSGFIYFIFIFSLSAACCLDQTRGSLTRRGGGVGQGQIGFPLTPPARKESIRGKGKYKSSVQRGLDNPIPEIKVSWESWMSWWSFGMCDVDVDVDVDRMKLWWCWGWGWSWPRYGCRMPSYHKTPYQPDRWDIRHQPTQLLVASQIWRAVW